jgi:hypothetical protein
LASQVPESPSLPQLCERCLWVACPEPPTFSESSIPRPTLGCYGSPSFLSMYFQCKAKSVPLSLKIIKQANPPPPFQTARGCGECDVLGQASSVSRPADLVLWSSGLALTSCIMSQTGHHCLCVSDTVAHCGVCGGCHCLRVPLKGTPSSRHQRNNVYKGPVANPIHLNWFVPPQGAQ